MWVRATEKHARTAIKVEDGSGKWCVTRHFNGAWKERETESKEGANSLVRSLDPYRIGPGMSIDENGRQQDQEGGWPVELPSAYHASSDGNCPGEARPKISPVEDSLQTRFLLSLRVSDKVEGIPNSPATQSLSVKTADWRWTDDLLHSCSPASSSDPNPLMNKSGSCFSFSGLK